MILFKKLFLLNSHKYFCINYLVDEYHLGIEDKNFYSALETLTLMPIYNYPLFEKFKKANTWVHRYFPNFPFRDSSRVVNPGYPTLKKLTEPLFPGKAGDLLDHWFMKLTVAFWKRKFGQKNPELFKNALRSRKYVSKHHPRDFQEKVLNRHREKLREFEKLYKLDLKAGHAMTREKLNGETKYEEYG